MSKTNINYTAEIIGGYRMNDNNIDVEYFAHLVDVIGTNNETLYNEGKSNKSALSVAKNWICSFINEELKRNGYPNYVCTYTQVRKLLNNQLKAVENAVIEHIEILRV